MDVASVLCRARIGVKPFEALVVAGITDSGLEC